MSALARTRGFTLIELMIAIGLGLLVAYVAYAGFNAAAQTVTSVNRMALENRLMRTGLHLAMDEADYWRWYDDPSDPAGQALRASDRIDGEWGLDEPMGLPFTPMRDIPPENEFDPTDPWQLRSAEPVLASLSELEDDAFVFRADRDRGWDARRPYQANDPRRWFRGNRGNDTYTDKWTGRYGLFTNRHKEPVLGHGHDQRELGNGRYRLFGRNWDQGDNGDGSGPLSAPWDLIMTGPYGPYRPGQIDSRTHTWQAHQTIHLHRVMGNYGVMDYLPSNATYGHYGAELRLSGPDTQARFLAQGFKQPYQTGYAQGTIRAPVDGWLRIDEHPDLRWIQRAPKRLSFRSGRTSYPWNDWYENPTNWRHTLLMYGSKPFSGLIGASNGVHGLFPASPYTGAWVVGELQDASQWYFKDGLKTNGTQDTGGDRAKSANSTLGTQRLLSHHRTRWVTANDQHFQIAVMNNRAMMVQPVLPQKPADWPTLQVSAMRYVIRGHQVHDFSVRWTDTATAETAELRFNILGTSLRGARQQRHRDGGWADYRGFDDPANDPTLDSPP